MRKEKRVLDQKNFDKQSCKSPKQKEVQRKIITTCDENKGRYTRTRTIKRPAR